MKLNSIGNTIYNFFSSKNLFLSVIGFALWLVLTLKFAYLKAFNTDEIWAWNIAQDLNLHEIKQLMHYEGHSFLWYLILKPFTILYQIYPDIYPFVLKYINLFFLFSGMVLLWFFSPFNFLIRLFVSLSAPFLLIYPSIARPYSLAILLLFSVTVLYKNRLRHPLIYACLLFLLAHTCFNGLIGAVIFGLFFIYDLYRENKDNLLNSKFLFPIFILGSGCIIHILEWFPVYPALFVQYRSKMAVIWHFLFSTESSKFQLYNLFVLIVWLPVLQITIFLNYLYTKSKRFLIYLFFVVNVFLIFYMVIAPGADYHLYFLYIYMIVLYWLMADNNEEFKASKPANISFGIFILLVSMIYFIPFRDPDFFFTDQGVLKESEQEIKELIPINSRIYLVPDYSQTLIVPLKDDYDLRTHYGDKIPSLDAYRNIYQELFVFPEDLYIDKTKNNYYIISKNYVDWRYEIGASDIHYVFENNKNCIIIKDLYFLCQIL